MTDNNEWLQRVVSKLNEVHLNGSNFFEERWIFDWDDKLSNTDNFKNIQREERALSTLNGAKVVNATYKDNFYRDQQEESLALHGHGMWGDFEGADPALRLYDYIWYLWEFDYDRFQKFCAEHELKPSQQLKSTKSKTDDVTPAPETNNIKLHQLEPRHYSNRKGLLTLNSTVDVAIVAKGKTKRPDGTKYLQCQIIERLFKSVNNIKYGINFGQALTVNSSKIGKKEEKEIRNAVYEINKKVASVGGPDNLIKIQNKKVFVNNSYL